MLLTFDTESGAFLSTVPNYVEGGDHEITLVLPSDPEQCPHCIGEHFEQIENYLNANMHEIYEALDHIKRKHLKKSIEYAIEALRERQIELSASIVFDPDCLECNFELGSIVEQIRILEELHSFKKHEIKAHLKLIGVMMDPGSDDLIIHFGVDEVDIPLVYIGASPL